MQAMQCNNLSTMQTSLRVKILERPRSRVILTILCEIYLQQLDQVPIVNIREQLPCASRRGRGKRTSLKYSRVFFTPVVKNPPGSGRSPGGGHHYPLQYSCLENSLDRGGWWATAHGVAKSWTILSDCTHTHPSGEESSVQSLSRVRLFVIP